VLPGVADVSIERGIGSGIVHNLADRATVGEVRSAILGDYLRDSHALYVQHAVRHEPIATTHALHVQHSVRLSQAEAEIADAQSTSRGNTAAAGVSTLLDPFAIGARRRPSTHRLPRGNPRRPAASPHRRSGTAGRRGLQQPDPQRRVRPAAACRPDQPHPAGAQRQALIQETTDNDLHDHEADRHERHPPPRRTPPSRRHCRRADPRRLLR
jgi:hypothetical protein